MIVADCSKFGTRALVRVAGFDAVDMLITDAEPPPALAELLRDAGVKVVVVAET